MARQDGIMPILGTIGKFTFFKSKDGHMVREKGSISASKIATDPAFQRTRENNAEFGRAGKATRVFRTAFRVLLLKGSDERMGSRLLKLFMKVIHADTVNPRGLRNVIDGEALLLEGFECNAQGTLNTILHAPYSVLFDRAAGTASVSIDSFSPLQMISAPQGATHTKISFAAGVIDFENEIFTVESAEGEWIPLTEAATTPVTLEAVLPPASVNPGFILLAIEFTQETNGVKYSLFTGIFNACAVIKVDAV